MLEFDHFKGFDIDAFKMEIVCHEIENTLFNVLALIIEQGKQQVFA
jgi:hypothetical protein